MLMLLIVETEALVVSGVVAVLFSAWSRTESIWVSLLNVSGDCILFKERCGLGAIVEQDKFDCEGLLRMFLNRRR
jgi:hypothetical protein